MRRWLRCIVALACCLAGSLPATARDDRRAEAVLTAWYDVSLLLVRHTPTYSPPVASRLFAYLGVTAFEAVASGGGDLRSLAGQLRELTPLPPRDTGKSYDDAIVLHAAMSAVIKELFANTGPTGQRVIGRLTEKLDAEVDATIAGDVIGRSRAYGEAIAAHILAWSHGDGGALIDNLGFPTAYELIDGPGHWVPTSTIALQQMPLLPRLGIAANAGDAGWRRLPIAAASRLQRGQGVGLLQGGAGGLRHHSARSPTSRRSLPASGPTTRCCRRRRRDTGSRLRWHLLDRDHADVDRRADMLARLGIAMSDAFIGCWHAKYRVRPAAARSPTSAADRSQVRAAADHAAVPGVSVRPQHPVGRRRRGDDGAVRRRPRLRRRDARARRPRRSRHFASFWAAAEEAALSRLYGGIHFRSAIERGLDQGRCIGGYANALKTKGG